MPDGRRKPNPHPNKARHEPTMRKAREAGQIVKITCTWCKITHRYRSDDLLELCGDVPIFDVPSKFRCERCRRKDHLDAALELPSAAEMVDMKIRKLVTIKTIRRPIWEDGTP